MDKVIEEAYEMGFNRFDENTTPSEFDAESFKELSIWSNSILPKLRCMAGFEENSYGTYTTSQDIAVYDHTNADDEPIEAKVTNSEHLIEMLIDAFNAGARDSTNNEEKGSSELPEL